MVTPRPWRKNGKTIICLICNKERYFPKSIINIGKGKFCSQICSNRNNALKRIGTHYSPDRIERAAAGRRGRKWNKLQKLRVSGKNNHGWKGNNAGYIARHDRMKRNYGQPNFCEGCGTEEAKRFDWANLDGLYSTNREDWLRLCRSCHVKIDSPIEKRKFPMNWDATAYYNRNKIEDML